MTRLAGVCTTWCALLALATASSAQDFPEATPFAGPDRALALLERGLPPAAAGWEIAAVGVRRFGLAEFETHAVAIGFGWRSLRGATGVSRSGSGPTGWMCAAVGAGVATSAFGAAVRGVARRDAAPEDRDPPSLEAGAGTWIAPASGWLVWTAHPQLAWQGDAPPLERGLELGIRAQGRGIELWLARASMPGSGVDRHRAGGALRVGAIRLAIEVREQPVRASLGVSVRRGGFAASAAVDEHPVLPGTTRLGAALNGRRSR